MQASFDHNRIIKNTAKERLTPHGLVQRGSSRTFLKDEGWYVIIVDFHPSGWSKGTYLNIGVDFNFYPRDHFASSYVCKGKTFEEALDEKHFMRVVNDYCTHAIKNVRKLNSRFSDIWSATREFKKQVHDTWDLFDLGILYGLGGKPARAKRCLNKVIREECTRDFEFTRQNLTKEILSWLGNGEFHERVKALITETRERKKLPATDLSNLTQRTKRRWFSWV